MCQLFVHLEEACHAVALGEVARGGEAIGLHHGAVVLLVGTAQLGRHGHLIVEVGQGAVGIEGAGIEDGLRRLLYLGLLRLAHLGPGEVVVDDILGVAVVALDSSANSSSPNPTTKIHRIIGICKPWSTKFSTTFSTVKEQITATNIPVRNSNFRVCFITCLGVFRLFVLRLDKEWVPLQY